MTRLTASQLREDLATAINRVAFAGERIILRRNKKDVAALVPIEDLALLEKLEDRLDYEDAEKVLAEMEKSGEKPIPWDEAKKQLGLPQ